MSPDLLILPVLLEALTAPHGEAWVLPHARSILRLVERIAQGMDYDRVVVICAAYLHDWGAFAAYRQSGVEHPLRSRQVVEAQVLPRLRAEGSAAALSSQQEQNLLDCIALHDYRDPRPAPTPEALLLREADALDLLGAVGIAREFAWGPNDLQKVTARIRARMQVLRGPSPPRGWFLLPAAQTIASQRLAEMEAFLGALEEEMRG
jgi:hypothetical protein